MAVIHGIREYAEGMPVEVVTKDGHECIMATNEGGFNHTLVDLSDLLAWLVIHRRDDVLEAMRLASSRHAEPPLTPLKLFFSAGGL